MVDNTNGKQTRSIQSTYVCPPPLPYSSPSLTPPFPSVMSLPLPLPLSPSQTPLLLTPSPPLTISSYPLPFTHLAPFPWPLSPVSPLPSSLPLTLTPWPSAPFPPWPSGSRSCVTCVPWWSSTDRETFPCDQKFVLSFDGHGKEMLALPESENFRGCSQECSQSWKRFVSPVENWQEK